MMFLRALLVVCLYHGTLGHPYRSWWNTKHKDQYVYSENPNITEVLSQVNMDTPIVEHHTKYEAENLHPRMEEVITDRVFQFIAYTIGYSTLIVGDNDKLIIIDAPESYPEAVKMISQSRKHPVVACKPIEAVIISLFHLDHMWGLKAFLEDKCNRGVIPDVYMHERLPNELELFETFKAIKLPKIFRMYGIFVPDPWHLHDEGADRLLLQPNPPGPYTPKLLEFPKLDTVVNKRIAGLDIEFHSIPGYTKDSIATCIPLLKMCHGGDIFFLSFPNIYTLRGEPARDARIWVSDARRIANLPNLETFTTSHAGPIKGGENIRSTLMNFADAIQNIHDQTVRYMLKGYPADVITPKIHLPTTQAGQTYLHENYGIIETSVKSIIDFYVGWFSGYAEDMLPVTRVVRTEKMINLLSEEVIYKEARRAYDDKEYRWAMEMISHLYNTDSTNRFYKELRALCMIRLAEGTPSVLSRHYLLSQVLEMWDLLPSALKTNTRGVIATLHLEGVFQNMQVHTNAEKLEAELNRPLSLYLNLTDENTYKLTFKHAILNYHIVTRVPAVSLTFETTEASFRSYIITDPFDSVRYGSTSGGISADVDHFFSYFDFQDDE